VREGSVRDRTCGGRGGGDGRPGGGRSGGGSAGRGKNHLRRGPQGRGREEDQCHQGRSHRHQPGLEGGQGPGGRRSQDRQGIVAEGGCRQAQERVGGSGRDGGIEVTDAAKPLDCDYLEHRMYVRCFFNRGHSGASGSTFINSRRKTVAKEPAGRVKAAVTWGPCSSTPAASSTSVGRTRKDRRAPLT